MALGDKLSYVAYNLAGDKKVFHIALNSEGYMVLWNLKSDQQFHGMKLHEWPNNVTYGIKL